MSKADSNVSSYNASPEEALAALSSHVGPVLIDLDETLYLRNSTEDFVDSARPSVVALFLLRVLDLISPWRIAGGDQTRDVWRVLLITLLLPWTLARWRRRVDKLARRFANRRLIAALKARSEPFVIVTSGFEPIVKPLIKALGFADHKLVAARFGSFSDRYRGKLHIASRALGTEVIAQSLTLTDSLQDEDLLKNSLRPLRTLWPDARFRRALGNTYLPGEYLTNVKRPGERYIMRGIVQEDFAFWALSSIGLTLHPVTHIIGLLCLALSFWAIYERGYVDNDMIAARYESDPALTHEFWESHVATPALLPWVWAAGAGAMGLWVLRRGDTHGMPIDALKWAAVLLATYTCFKLYNRLDKTTRVWLYPGLQFARAAAFAAIVPITPMGAVALCAHVVARWVPYQVYRLGAARWPTAQPNMMRLTMFVILGWLVAASLGPAAYWNWTSLGLLAWILFGVRREIFRVFKLARRLDTPSVRTPFDMSSLPRLPALSSPPLFTVVIPTHNRVAAIGRALLSVLNQSFDDFEVVIVDDGSSDGTQELLAPLTCPRTQVVRNSINVGVSESRNRGVAAARGEFIVFLDDDDEFRPQVLAALKERIEAQKPDFLWGKRIIHERAPTGQVISTRSDDWRDLPPALSGSEFLPLTLRLATSAIFTIRKDLFGKLGGFDKGLKVSEDRDLFITLAEGSYVGAPASAALIDVDESLNSLSRSVGVRGGADVDLRVIEKHGEYLRRPEHQEFLSEYLLVIFAAFLQAGKRQPAMRIVRELRQRGAFDSRVFRYYLRHAPEFRALKSAIRYNTLRRIRHRFFNRAAAIGASA